MGDGGRFVGGDAAVVAVVAGGGEVLDDQSEGELVDQPGSDSGHGDGEGGGRLDGLAILEPPQLDGLVALSDVAVDPGPHARLQFAVELELLDDWGDWGERARGHECLGNNCDQ